MNSFYRILPILALASLATGLLCVHFHADPAVILLMNLVVGAVLGLVIS